MDLYEIPGFGKTKPTCYSNLLHHYSSLVRDVIVENEYDYVIGHSMGGNILLRVLDMVDTKAKLILLSPEYMGISYLKPLTIFCPIMPLGLFVLQKMDCKFTTFIMKVVVLLTVNKWQQIDDRIILDNKMQLLRRDLCWCKLHQIAGIGHTAVVEAYDGLLKIICSIINTGDDD